MRRQWVYLNDLGVRVHAPRQWSVTVDPHPQWAGYVRSVGHLHTTQDRVWLDGVEEKKAKLIGGWQLSVTITDALEFGATHFWISNGHHTLAAYLALGRHPHVRWLARASGARAHRLPAPTFDQWATR